MTWPLQPYHTIDCALLIQQPANGATLSVTETVKLNILLDQDTAGFPTLFAAISVLKNNYIFSLPANLINNAATLTEILPAVYLLASFSQYAEGEAPVIPILSRTGETVCTANIEILKRYLYQQGLTAVQTPCFKFSVEATGVQEADSCYFAVADEDLHAGSIPKNAHLKPMILAYPVPFHDCLAFSKHIARMLTDAAFDVLSNHYIDKRLHEAEIQRWQKRSLVYKNFLALSKTVQEKEYYEVLNWYKKEYEILPLWYKRIGHIIKVLMGKRSFVSLFSDNVKKYKD